ncbi:MAG: hypothetical protein KatS3mg115_1644 [Candidatus Poribacteria bacterium]|nr:MAG: hypothetical protein KatS3mg115_1644 [Candidatus Poribacteria bacterium]
MSRDSARVLGRLVGAALLFGWIGASHARIDPKTIAGMWLFDEGKGDVVADLSGNGNDGTLTGNVDWVDGPFGGAVEFPGDVQSFVSVPHAESLTMEDEVTVMFWVRTEKEMVDMWNDRQIVVGKHYTEYEVGIYMDGQLHTYTSDGGGNYDEGILVSFAGKLPDGDRDWELGKWYHVAWTLQGQNEVAYVNGVRVGEHVKAHVGTRPGTHPLEIGRRVGGSLPLTGAVDEVIVLNVALEEEDVKSAMELGLGRATGITAVDPVGKVATTWGALKGR